MWKQPKLTSDSDFQRSPEQSMHLTARAAGTGVSKRNAPAVKGMVCHQGKSSMTSSTASDQILFDQASYFTSEFSM